MMNRIEILAGLLLFSICSCAGPAPNRFPPAWREHRIDGQGQSQFWYDLDGDTAADYAEVLDAQGRVESLRYRHSAAAGVREIRLTQIPESERLDLVILLDSVPFEIIAELRRQGRFRLFHPPSRVIAPFPVMTDLAFSELMGCSPTPGVEALRFDGRRLHGGTDSYIHLENSPWVKFVDYHLHFQRHGFAYLWPGMWFDHELRQIGERRQASAKSDWVGYCVGTSAYGAKYGRNGHVEAIIRLDQFCQRLVYDFEGRLRITLLSDHGHDLLPARRIPLGERLTDFGYRVGSTLERPEDVVVPEFGMVSCAAVYTRCPERVAGDVLGLEGVELAAFLNDADEVVVISRDGRATIRRRGPMLEYAAEFGDPLQLDATLHDRGSRAFESAQWLELTHDHEFPDAVARLWRAFHGLVEQTPSLLLSLEDGYFCGSADLADFYPMSAAHGNLRTLSSSAFAMSMAGPLPPVLRMEDLRSALADHDVQIGDP